MKELRIHPIAECYPPLPPQEFAELREHIRVNGLQSPIVLFEGMILDGATRYRACLELGLEPYFITPEISDPIAYVIGQNEMRRHLTTSQKAAVAEAIANIRSGTNQYALKEHFAHAKSSLSVEEAAKKIGVGRDTVYRVRRARKNGIPELLPAIKAGQLDANTADKIADLPKEEQARALKAATEKKTKKSVKQVKTPKEPKPKTNGFLSAEQIAKHQATMNAPSIYPEDLPLPVHPKPALNAHLQEAFVDLKKNEPLIPKMSRRWLYEEVWVYTQRIQTFAPGYGKPPYMIEDIDPLWIQWVKSVAGKVRAAEFLLLNQPKAPADSQISTPRKISHASFEKQLKRWLGLVKRGLDEILFAPDEESRVLQATEQILLLHFEGRRTKRMRPHQTGEPK